MKVVSLFLAVAALGSAAAQGFTWDGTVAGPCSLSANFPAGNANCPDPASQRAICQGRFTVQPDGAPVAGAGTLSNPTLVPVKLTYENNPQCTTTMQQHNVSVFSSSEAGTKLSLLSVVQSSGESDTVTGTELSAVISGTYRASFSAEACDFTYTVNSGACFMSDVPAAASSRIVSVSAFMCMLIGAVAASLL